MAKKGTKFWIVLSWRVGGRMIVNDAFFSTKEGAEGYVTMRKANNCRGYQFKVEERRLA